MAAKEPLVIPLRRSRRRFDPAKMWLKWRRFAHQVNLFRQWWMKEHTPYQALFIIATPRSGSNLLVDYVRRLPGVQSHWEILNWGLFYSPGRRATSQAALRHIRYSLHTLDSPIRGCKLFLEHLANYRLTLDALDAAFPNSKYIVLYRQSLGEQYASHELAKLTSQWSLIPGQTPKQTPITINPAKLREYCDRVRRAYHDTLSTPWLAQRAVLLSYEDLIADPSYWIGQRVCSLLGVSAAELETNFCKQNPQPLADRIANYPEVAPLLNSALCQQRHTWPGAQRARRRAA